MLRTAFLVLVKVFGQREDFVTEYLEHFPRFEVLKPNQGRRCCFSLKDRALNGRFEKVCLRLFWRRAVRRIVWRTGGRCGANGQAVADAATPSSEILLFEDNKALLRLDVVSQLLDDEDFIVAWM